MLFKVGENISGFLLEKKPRAAFTLIELLLAMVIIGILSGVIFVGVGNQRQKAKVNAMMQIASGVAPLARDCYFRNKNLNSPALKGGGDICTVVKAQWPEIKVEECVYLNFDSTDKTYGIECVDFGKKIICGVDSANYGCKEKDLP